MADSGKDILVYNGSRYNQKETVQSGTVKTLRKELSIPSNAAVSINGVKAGETMRIKDGDVVSWVEGDKSGA